MTTFMGRDGRSRPVRSCFRNMTTQCSSKTSHSTQNGCHSIHRRGKAPGQEQDALDVWLLISDPFALVYDRKKCPMRQSMICSLSAFCHSLAVSMILSLFQKINDSVRQSSEHVKVQVRQADELVEAERERPIQHCVR